MASLRTCCRADNRIAVMLTDHSLALAGFPAGITLVAAAVFALAGVVKGVVGLGLPTVSMALLALIMPPAQAAALLIVPSLITNLWQVRPWSGAMALLARLAPMQLAVFVGTLAGAWLLGAPSGTWAQVSLGVALIVYAGIGLAGRRWPVSTPTERWLSPLCGVLTGLVTAATGVFVIPAVPYLQALGLQRDALVQAMGISFIVATIALALGLYVNANYAVGDLAASLLMLLPALAGMYMGQVLRQRLSTTVFRTCLMGSLAVLGAHMVLHELWLR
jgi:uncharacterized membrane protein YfcA